MQFKRDHILIAGIPAAGKSTFCRWLSREHQYVHWEFDQMIADPRAYYPKEIEPLLDMVRESAPEKIEALTRQLPERLVIDWGFPPKNIDTVIKLKATGFRIFWFDGDHARARQDYIARGTASVQNLDIQMPDIQEALPQIRALFFPNMIDVLEPNGQRMPANDIWQIIGAG
ncbi:MAG: hypothetical protein HY078_12610 [Elusimicrobia bacterium]|nr:hypothetical protein [Elusimicrobiota bacterium]